MANKTFFIDRVIATREFLQRRFRDPFALSKHLDQAYDFPRDIVSHPNGDLAKSELLIPRRSLLLLTGAAVVALALGRTSNAYAEVPPADSNFIPIDAEGTTHSDEVALARSSSELISAVVIPFDKGSWYSTNGDRGFFLPAALDQQFQASGGIGVYGNITTQPFKDKEGRTNIGTEKVIWQIDEQGNINFANVLSVLSEKRGMDRWLSQIYQIPDNQNFPAEQGMTYEQVAANRAQILEPYPQIQDYLAADPRSFDFFGLPVSSQDLGGSVMFRFERGALRLSKEGAAVIPTYGGEIALKSDSIFPLETLKPVGKSEIAKTTPKSPERSHLIERFGGDKDPLITIDYDSPNPAVKIIPDQDFQSVMTTYAEKMAKKEAVPTSLYIFEEDSYLSDPHFANDTGKWLQFYDQKQNQSFDFMKVRPIDIFDNKGVKIRQDVYIVFNSQNAKLSLSPEVAADRNKHLLWYLLAGIDYIGVPTNAQTSHLTTTNPFRLEGPS